MNKWILMIMVALLSTTVVYALPTGPTGPIVPTTSSRFPTWVSQSTIAYAGNVTEIDLTASSITRTWQGYYGNVTGTIVLGDSSNNTLYDWSVANPQGEVYAVRSATVPTWTGVRCSNTTEINNEDTALGVNQSVDEDSVNNTFIVGSTTHPLFYVANSTITNNTCPVVGLYNETGTSSPYFKQVLLSDGGTVPIIYTAILAHTLNPSAESMGFDGVTHDFQMIVGENGHGSDVAVSTYYFYLELE